MNVPETDRPDGMEIIINDDKAKFYHPQVRYEADENKDSLSDSEVLHIKHSMTHVRYDHAPGQKFHCTTARHERYTYQPMSIFNTICDCNRWLHIVSQVTMKRSQQTTISFILGLVVGITLTALMFQQNILVGKSSNLRTNTLLDGGFMYRTLYPLSRTEKRDVNHELSELFPDSLRDLNHPQTSQDSHSNIEAANLDDNVQSNIPKQITSEVNVGAKVFVGVITAEKFLPTRAVAVNSTWGTQADKIAFFTELGSSEEYGIPVINLEGVSDKEYPPQKKAFNMLKYMCQNHIDEYDWFIRADDDVYIRVEKLKKFLGQIDSEKLIYMGQPGHGVPEVREKLGLNGHNFCMGGPSVIFNRKALKKLCSHLDECMTEVVSGEEDVEIGRCVSNHLHIECTHAWETLKLFYHSYQEEYTEEKPFLGNLAENIHVEKAITLHHVKVPYIMYKIHRHFTSQLLNSSTQAIMHLHEQAQLVNELLPPTKYRDLTTVKVPPLAYKARSSSEVSVWKAFNVESIFGLSPACPDSDITNDNLADLKQIGETAIDAAIDRSSSHLTYSHVSGGYFRSDPLRGTDYVLDIAFSSKEMGKADEVKRVHILRPLSEFKVSSVRRIADTGEKVNFFVVMPVLESASGKFETFMRKFYEPYILQKFSEAKPSRTSVTLIVSVYEQKVADGQQNPQDSISPTVYDIVGWYRVKYPHSSIEIVPSTQDDKTDTQTMSRGSTYAYTQGVLHAAGMERQMAGHAIGLLTTTNFSISHDLLMNCLLRTSVVRSDHGVGDPESPKNKFFFYQPVPFSVYPAVSTSPNSSPDKLTQLIPKKDVGYWDLRDDPSPVGLNLPICSSLENLLSLTDPSTPGGKSSESSIHDNLYDDDKFIFRVPDKNMLTLPGR